MATTKISDIIVPTLFNGYQVNRTKETSILFTSGIVAPNETVQAAIQGGGKVIHLPFWKDLTGDVGVSSDNEASYATPDKITADEQVGVVLRRNKSFSATDLAAAVAGSDPIKTIAERLNPYWNRQFQATLLSTAQGVFSALGTSAVVDISHATAPTTANNISGSAVIDARGTMGDAADDIRIMAVHSKVYQQLQKQNEIEFIRPSENGLAIPTYKGMVVIQSDNMPVTGSGATTKYTSYFFGNGAFAYGETPAKTPVEVDRDSLAGDGEGVEFFVNRRHFILHPVGFKWGGSPAGQSPTNAELATGASWTRVFERKQVPMAALVTNIT